MISPNDKWLLTSLGKSRLEKKAQGCSSVLDSDLYERTDHTNIQGVNF